MAEIVGVLFGRVVLLAGRAGLATTGKEVPEAGKPTGSGKSESTGDSGSGELI